MTCWTWSNPPTLPSSIARATSCTGVMNVNVLPTPSSRFTRDSDLILCNLLTTFWEKILGTTAVPGDPGLNYLQLDSADSTWKTFGKISSLEHLLIRQEYLELIGFVENTSPSKKSLPIHLTGQPGIGQMLFYLHSPVI